MGPTQSRLRGIGGLGGATASAPPTAIGNGSGGPGVLGTPLNATPAFDELSDITTGRLTLGAINFVILAMIGFYIWTRSAQGGG